MGSSHGKKKLWPTLPCQQAGILQLLLTVDEGSDCQGVGIIGVEELAEGEQSNAGSIPPPFLPAELLLWDTSFQQGLEILSSSLQLGKLKEPRVHMATRSQIPLELVVAGNLCGRDSGCEGHA